MASANVETARESLTVPGGALGEAIQQVIQGLANIQEAVVQQERRMEERMREMERKIRENDSKQERRLQQERQSMKATVASRVKEAKKVVTLSFGDKLRRVEAKVEALEKRCPTSKREETGISPGAERRLALLESRIERLEASTERALKSVLPRVDVLLKQVETSSPPVSSTHPNFTATRDVSSSPPFLSSASASSPASHSPWSSTGCAATPPLTPERRKELGQQLMKAIVTGSETEVVQRLLDEGADVNYSVIYKATPLMNAVSKSHKNVASLLIRRGANVNASDDFRSTALHYSSIYDTTGRCASLLIRAGALVDSANRFGATPLHRAAEVGNEAAARALLAAGASKSVRDNGGKTPSKYAANEHLRLLLRR